MAAVAPEMVLAQVRAVLADIGADAVKVGMLGTLETARAVAAALEELPAGTPVVVDPVMVAESGARLLEPSAERFLAERILPLATRGDARTSRRPACWRAPRSGRRSSPAKPSSSRAMCSRSDPER